MSAMTSRSYFAYLFGMLFCVSNQNRIPSPYKNEEAGRTANNGAFPPDLSLMAKARYTNFAF